MTTDELEKLLVQQPIALLHRLARGRVHRHFRAGKRRLIELLLRHSADNRQGLRPSISLSDFTTPTARAKDNSKFVENRGGGAVRMGTSSV